MEALTALKSNGEAVNLPYKSIDDLRKNFKGGLFHSGDDRYEECRLIWNGMIDRKPAIIARCKSADDVVAAVRFARQHDLLISVRSGGHHVSGKSICDKGMVIDLYDMRGVRVDKDRQTAMVDGGAKLGDIDKETHKYGLVAPLGVVSATGVAGLALHGGYGWHSRKYGLSLDNILSMEVVTADGKLVKASADENPDLFWALRGGGGNFGIVTSFEFKLYPIGSKIWQLFTFHPVSDSKKCLEFMRDYMPDAPDELSVIGVFWNAPDEEFIPEKYRGQPVFIFLGCYTGSLEEGEKAIAPFRKLGTPVADLSEPVSFVDFQQLLDEDYPDGRNYYWKSSYINKLDGNTIDMLIDYAAKRPSPINSLDVWALGGKMSRIDSDSAAFYQRKSPFMIGMEANWDDPAQTDANVKWARNVYDDLMKTNDIGLYLNFPGFGEEGDDLLRKTYGPNYDRLKEIKKKYDPDNFFKGFISLNGNGSR